MTDHGFQCECGDPFESLEALRYHVDTHGNMVMDDLNEKLEGRPWTVINEDQMHDGRINYIDLDKNRDSRKVSSTVVGFIEDLGYDVIGWHPDVTTVDDGDIDMRIWLEKQDK